MLGVDVEQMLVFLHMGKRYVSLYTAQFCPERLAGGPSNGHVPESGLLRGGSREPCMISRLQRNKKGNISSK